MKGFLVLMLSTTLVGKHSWAQNIIPQALVKTEINEWGDPTINITDPDGLQQGDWLYQDITGKRVIRQYYLDNSLVNSYFNIGSLESTLQWESTSNWNIDPALNADLLNFISNSFGTIQSDQQILLLFDNTGTLSEYYFLGNWTEIQSNELLASISNYINAHQPLNLSYATYVLL